MSDKRLKILIFISRYWPSLGGSEVHTRKLTQEMSRAASITVVTNCSLESYSPDHAFCLNHNKDYSDYSIVIKQLSAHPPIRYVLKAILPLCSRYKVARGLYSVIQYFAFRRQVQGLVQQHDLVHSVYNGATPCVRAIADVAKALGKPFIFTPLSHTTLPYGTGWSSKSIKKLYCSATSLIAMTEYERQWLYNISKTKADIYVCPVAPLLSSYENKRKPPLFDPILKKDYVLFLGRLVDCKGYKVLVQSADYVWQHFPDLHFVFVGPHSDSSASFFMTKNDEKIHCLGTISEEDKTLLLQNCTMLCVPSTEESLGVIYLEAWSFSKPVIAADIPVMHSVISHGNDGLLCKVEPKTIANSIIDIISDPEYASSLGRAGKIKVKDLYEWPLIAENMLKIYKSSINRIQSASQA